MDTETKLREMLQTRARFYRVNPLDASGLCRRRTRDAFRRNIVVALATLGVLAASAGVFHIVQAQNSVAVAAGGPSETRLAEFNNVSFTVPSTWGDNQVRCGSAIANTVVYEPQGNTYCDAHDPKVTAVHFVPSSLRMARSWIDLARSHVVQNGVGVDIMPTRHMGDKFFAAVVVPDRGVTAWIEGPDKDSVETVLTTLQVH